MPRQYTISCPCASDATAKVCDKGIKRTSDCKKTDREFREFLQECMASHVHDCHFNRCRSWRGALLLVRQRSRITVWDWDSETEEKDCETQKTQKTRCKSRAGARSRSRSTEGDSDDAVPWWWPLDLQESTDDELKALHRAVVEELQKRIGREV